VKPHRKLKPPLRHKPPLKLLLLKVVKNLNSKTYYKKKNLSNLRGFFMLSFLDI
jgi:hypothetical protein